MTEFRDSDQTSSPQPTTDLAKLFGKTRRFGKVGSEVVDAGWPELRPPERVDPDLPVPTPEMPNLGVRVARRRRLLRVAGTQTGLFTVAQAAEAGLDRSARHHHLSYGNWRPTDAPGVFRLSGWPPDPHERLRAWQIWAGPAALLTSWTALGLAGVTASGPRVRVGLEIPFSRDRSGTRRRERMLRQLDRTGAADMVEIHRPASGGTRAYDGLIARPPEEAICAVIARQPSGVGVDLAIALLERGHLDERALRNASQLTGCSSLTEFLFHRLVG